MDRIVIVYVLVIGLAIAHGFNMRVESKNMTTYERQLNLMKRVNTAQKNNQLTVRQAKGLRKDLSKIATKKQKARDKHQGRAGLADMESVEQRLDETSEKINERIKDNIEDRRD